MHARTSLRIIAVSCLFLAICGCHSADPTPARSTPDDYVSPPFQPIPGDPPTVARKIVFDALAHPDPRIRSNAVEVVATTGEVRMMPGVVQLLQDQSVPVRFLAAIAVGDLQYQLARDEVGVLLNDRDLNVRLAAAYALMKLGQPTYFQVLRDAVGNEDQTVRANAALLLGKSGQQEALRYLYWTLQDKNSADKVLLQAVESIAMLHDQRIYPKIWTQLISAYADDRIVGIRAMGALGTEQATNAITTLLDDAVLEVRLAAAAELGKLGQTIGEPEVQAVFDQNLLANMDPTSAERVRVWTALAIGNVCTTALLRHLPDMLQDQSNSVRLAAAKGVLLVERRRQAPPQQPASYLYPGPRPSTRP